MKIKVVATIPVGVDCENCLYLRDPMHYLLKHTCSLFEEGLESSISKKREEHFKRCPNKCKQCLELKEGDTVE